MNEVEIIEWWHYKCQNVDFWIRSKYTDDVYVKSLANIEVKSFWWKKSVVPWVVYSFLKDGSFEKIMTLEHFKKIVLYKV